MQLVSLKIPKEKKSKPSDTAPSISSPQYPYDSRITIRDDVLKKMKGLYDDGKVKDTVTIKAKGKIVRTSSNEDIPYGKDKPKESTSVEIQITDIAVELDNEGDMQAGFDEEAK